jgi:hypothetical protein
MAKADPFVAEVRDFLNRYWPGETRPGRLSDPGAAGTAAFLARLAERGWTVPEWPARWGGAALPPERAYRLDRMLVEAGAPVPDPIPVDLVGPLIMAFGRVAQCTYWLPSIARGLARWRVHPSLTDGVPVTGTSAPTVETDGVSGMVALVTDSHGAVAVALVGAARAGGEARPVERLGAAAPPSELLPRLAQVIARSHRAARAHTARLIRRLEVLRRAGRDEASLARRLDVHAVTLMGLEAMERRAFAPGHADERLVSAVRIRAAELGADLAALAVDALGYYALPAPEAGRHNELGGGLPGGEDAIEELIRYVWGREATGERDRLWSLTQPGPVEG